VRVAFQKVELPLPNLRVPREEARTKVDAQLKKGREIRKIMEPYLVSQKDLETARAKMTKWVDYVKDLLHTLLYNGSVVEEFAPTGGYAEIVSTTTFREEVGLFLESIDGYIFRLESIHDRLDLARETDTKESKRLTLVQTPQRIYSMTEIDDAERTRQSAKERLEKNDYLGVFRDSQQAVESAVKALLSFLDIEYKNVHDVSGMIPIAIRKVGEKMVTTKYILARIELAQAALWLHVLCSTKDYFYGIKEVGVPAGDIFHAELGAFAAACVNTTDIVVTNLNRLVRELAYSSTK
jgi:hypothetical protein